MSYFVIKGPYDCGQYLCDYRPVHTCPQWHHDRNRAFKFTTAAEARTFAASLPGEHVGCGDWGTRVVRVVSKKERHAERAALRQSLRWTIDVIDHELPPFPDASGDDGEAMSQYYFASNMRAARALLHKRADFTKNEDT